MGILDDTLTAFGSRATGAGPARGVNYFSSDNFAPGLDNIGEEIVPGSGVQPVRSENFGSRSSAPPVTRDTTQDPLSAGEVRGMQAIQTALPIIFGPAGSVMSAAVDYNLGKESGGNMNPRNVNVATPDTLAGRTGFWSAQGNDLDTSAQAARATGGLGRFAEAQLPAGLRGAELYRKFGVEYAGQGFRGVGYTGYDVNSPQFVPGQEVVNDADIVENGPGGTVSAGGSGSRWSEQYGWGTPTRPNFSDRGPGGSSGDSEAAAAGASAAGPGGGSDSDSYANGGIVGLSGPRYADGGAVTPMLSMGFADGGGIEGSQPSPETVNQQVSQILRNPQMRQRIVAGAQQLMQTGELTPQEVTTMGQIAEASMQNPALYPKLRQFVAQQGMSPLPPSFDPSVIVKILAISRALAESGGGMAAPGGPGVTPPGQVPPTDQAQMQNPAGMANGGFLQGPGTGRSDSIGTVNESTGQPVRVANGEYVIPKHVVDAKGRDFFDKMLRQYAQVNGGGDKA